MIKNFFSKFKALNIYIRCLIYLFIVSIIFTTIYFVNKPDKKAVSKEYDNNIQYEFDMYANELFIGQLSSDSLGQHFYISNPKEWGLDSVPVTLGTYSYDEMSSSQKYYVNQIQYLKQFDYNKLLSSQQLTFDVLMSSFKSQLDFGDLCLCSQVLSPTTGLQAQFPVLFSEYSFKNKKDIDDYLTLLSQLKGYYAQICDFEIYKAEHNSFISSSSCQKIIEQCQSFIGDGTASNNLLHTSFLERINKASFIEQNQKEQFIKSNLNEIENSVIPAYRQIIETLSKLKEEGYCKNENGLFYLENGKDYYQYLVTSYTGSSKNVMEIKSDIQNKLARDMRTMYSLMNVNPELEHLLEEQKSEVRSPADILSDLQKKAGKDFPIPSDFKYKIKYVDKSLENFLSPAFYLTPPIDSPDENTIYINNSKTDKNQDLYVTLAHEGIPGHMMQANYFASTTPLPIRQLLNFGGYSEGWATYVEFMSYHYQYDNEQLAEALSCSSSYSLALYSLCDIGVNYEGWTLKDLKKFLSNYNITDEAASTSMFEAVVEEPANYLKYYVGYLEILSLKERVQAKIGADFNLKKFHEAFLSIGPADFDTIEKWIYKRYSK